MAKITITNSLKIKGQELKDIAEIANLSDKRSKVKFDSNNILTISKAGYPVEYIKPYDYEQNKNKAGYYQKLHTLLKLGKHKGEIIYINKKNTRPLLAEGIKLFNNNINKAGKYSFSYNESTGKTIIKKPDNTLLLETDKIVFNLIVSGAGGGGRGSLYNTKYYVVWGSQYISLGAAGGGGGVLHCIVDMSKIKNLSISLGQGGNSSNAKDTAKAGENTIIIANSNNIIIPGGGAGSEYGYADVSSIDWDFDLKYKNEFGQGGKNYFLTEIEGLYFVKSNNGIDGRSYSSNIIFNDQYGHKTNSLIYLCENQGGQGGYLPNKPAFAIGSYDSKTSGSSGKNGFFQIFY